MNQIAGSDVQNSMKIIPFLMAVSLTLSLPTHAQKTDKQNRRMEHQASTIAPSGSNPVAVLATALQNITLNESQKTKLHGAAFKLEAEILALLTPEQQAQFKEAQEKLKKETRDQQKRTQQQRGVFTDLQDTLVLSPEQQAQLAPSFAEAERKLMDRKEKSKAVLEGLRDQLRPLLTPQQQVRMDAWKPKGKK